MLKDQSRMFYTGRDRELIVGQYMQYGNGGGGFVYSYTVRRFAVVSGRPQFLLERLLDMVDGFI